MPKSERTNIEHFHGSIKSLLGETAVGIINSLTIDRSYGADARDFESVVMTARSRLTQVEKLNKKLRELELAEDVATK